MPRRRKGGVPPGADEAVKKAERAGGAGKAQRMRIRAGPARRMAAGMVDAGVRVDIGGLY